MTEKDNTLDQDTGEDISGRDRMAWNTIISWLGHLATVLAGFVLPRMIDEQIGQVSLGVWDLCWSFVNYLGIFGAGLPSSANRYIANYRAANQMGRLEVLIGTVALIQLFQAVFVAAVVVTISLSLPLFYADNLEEHLDEAQWVIIFLGATYAIQMYFSVARGIITGLHRWDYHNGIKSATALATLIAMLTVLYFDGGLVELSISYLVVNFTSELFRRRIAHIIFPNLKIKYKNASLEEAKSLILFGGKTFVAYLPMTAVTQTTSIMLAASMGPAALAVFLRPLSLIQHTKVFILQFTQILTPTASSLQGTGDSKVLKSFFVQSATYTSAFTFPPIIGLLVFGDIVLELWMGPQYANWTLIAILAGGHTLSLSQDASLKVIIGMNQHGRLSLWLAMGVLVVYAIGFVIISIVGMSLVNAALMLVVPRLLVYGIFPPVYGCHKLNISLSSYVLRSFIIPLLSTIPFSLILVFARSCYLDDNYLLSLALILLAGVTQLVIFYFTILSDDNRAMITEKISKMKRKLYD